MKGRGLTPSAPPIERGGATSSPEDDPHRYDVDMRGKLARLVGLGVASVLMVALATVVVVTSYSAAVKIGARGQFALLFAVGFGLASVMWFL